MKNPQTTIAPTFLTHIISAIDGVIDLLMIRKKIRIKINNQDHVVKKFVK